MSAKLKRIVTAGGFSTPAELPWVADGGALGPGVIVVFASTEVVVGSGTRRYATGCAGVITTTM
jgi:hypothetical protein